MISRCIARTMFQTERHWCPTGDWSIFLQSYNPFSYNSFNQNRNDLLWTLINKDRETHIPFQFVLFFVLFLFLPYWHSNTAVKGRSCQSADLGPILNLMGVLGIGLVNCTCESWISKFYDCLAGMPYWRMRSSGALCGLIKR